MRVIIGVVLSWCVLSKHTIVKHFGLRGFAVVKKIQKIKLDRAHKPIQLFFLNPILTWTEQANHNNKQLSTNRIGILLQIISTGVGLLWDDFNSELFLLSKAF